MDTSAPLSAGKSGLILRLIRDQRVAFLIVGGLNTLIGFGWFVLFQITVGRSIGDWGYMAALVLSHVTSVICAFLLQRYFVFRVRGHFWLDLGRFELVQLTSFGINLVALPLAVQILHIPPIPANAVITVITVTMSYFAHRYFSFRRKETS